MASDASPELPARTSRGVLNQIVTDHFSQFIFVATAVVVGLAYTVLLPFGYTQRLSLHNWNYLDTRFIAFSLAFGLVTGWIVTVQVFAMRRIVAQRSATLGSAGAATVGLLPSLLCCSPVVPTLLGLFGVSGISLSHTTGRVQYFFASEQNAILLVSLAMVVGAAVWSSRRVVRAACLTDETCDLPIDREFAERKVS